MTFDTQLCDNVFDALGRKDTLRHAYRVYLWRRVRGLIDHSRPGEAPTADADICSLIRASTPSSDRPRRSDVACIRERSWRM
jgi:hypothetical protein